MYIFLLYETCIVLKRCIVWMLFMTKGKSDCTEASGAQALYLCKCNVLRQLSVELDINKTQAGFLT